MYINRSLKQYMTEVRGPLPKCWLHNFKSKRQKGEIREKNKNTYVSGTEMVAILENLSKSLCYSTYLTVMHLTMISIRNNASDINIA